MTVVAGAAMAGVPALTANPFVIGGVSFVGGLTIVLWNVITVSLRQRISPDRLLGRVNSGYRLVAWGSMPLGALLAGLLANLFGLRAVFAVMGVATLTLLALMPLLTDAAIDEAERAGDG